MIILNKITNFFIGILLGTGAILPGISSGVICVILGMYDKLVESIFNLFKDFKKNFLYLFPIALGGFFGVFLFGNILKALFDSYPTQTSFCFIGLIAGSIPILIKKINKEHTFKLRYALFTIIAFLVGCLLVFLENHISANYEITNFSTLFLIASGFLMSIGVVVPGVSNTLILMCIGIYPVYLNAIATLNLSILFPMGIGLVLGCLFFLFIIKFLLEHYYMQTYYSIIGFTLGSMLVLYSPLSFDFNSSLCIVLLIIGFAVASKFEKLS